MDRLISANKLIDVFYYGIDDKCVLSSTKDDSKVIDIIESQPTVDVASLLADKLSALRNNLDPHNDTVYKLGFFSAISAVESILDEISRA